MTHFLDINKTDPAALRSIIDNAINMKQARKDTPRGQLDKDTPLQDALWRLSLKNHPRAHA